MSNLSPTEEVLIRRHLHKIHPIQDGFHQCITFLNKYFTLVDYPIDPQFAELLESNLHCISPDETRPFELHGYSIHSKDVYRDAPFLLSEHPVFVVLATHFGCVFCNNHRLDMELSIRNTISQEDISTRNNVLRYRVFCYAELEQYP